MFSVCLDSESVSSPLRNKEVKRQRQREGERMMEDDGSQNEDATSIFRWDKISIIQFDLTSSPLCLPLREPRCQVVFSPGWVKPGLIHLALPRTHAQTRHYDFMKLEHLEIQMKLSKANSVL